MRWRPAFHRNIDLLEGNLPADLTSTGILISQPVRGRVERVGAKRSASSKAFKEIEELGEGCGLRVSQWRKIERSTAPQRNRDPFTVSFCPAASLLHIYSDRRARRLYLRLPKLALSSYTRIRTCARARTHLYTRI